jgi:hypothetical protein
MPWPRDNSPVQPQLTPGMALWNYIRNSVPAQLGAAGQMAQSVAQPFTNLFGNGGQEFWGGPQNPQAAQDMRNALLATYAGSALNPAEDGALNAGLKVYRGSPTPEIWPPNPEVHGNNAFWASSDPKVSATYADRGISNSLPNIMPAEADFKNPLVVDARGEGWGQIPIGHKANVEATNHLPTDREAVSSDYLAMLARAAGHDGLVINNVLDELGPAHGGLWSGKPKPATTIAALQPGTVKSPLTGETLFSGGQGNPLLAAIMGLIGQQSQGKQ